jgi:WD40 repeat protein
MSRPVLAACAVLVGLTRAPAADPAPLWEIDVPGAADPLTAPGWLGFSPDGRAVVAVLVREGSVAEEYAHTLRVWDAGTRRERFTADLGKSRTPSWGADLVAFPTDAAVQTAGPSPAFRQLADGALTTLSSDVPVMADHVVWVAPDVGETFYLRREPDREGRPLELVLRSNVTQQFDEWGGRRGVGGNVAVRRAEVRPPRDGLRPQAMQMNPGRNRLAAAFRDDAPGGGPARHGFVLYAVRTVDEFAAEASAEAVTAAPVGAVAFARDGRTVASGGEDGSVGLWDVWPAGRAWKPRATVGGGGGRVAALAFRPDWRVLAAATWDGKGPNLRLIDADTGALVRAVRVENGVTAVAWSPDGRVLLTGGYGGKVRAWDAAALLAGDGAGVTGAGPQR